MHTKITKILLGSILFAASALPLAAFASGTIGMPPNNLGLVGYWTFDGKNLINNVTDTSGQGNNGYLVSFPSTTTVMGKIGQALSFSGGDYADMGSAAVTNFDRNNPFSIGVWFKTSNQSSAQYLVAKEEDGSNYTGYSLWLADGCCGNQYLGVYLVSTLSSYIQVSTNTSNTFNDGNWHYVLMTYDGSSAASGVKMYVDGVPQTLTINNDNLTTSMASSFDLLVGDRDFSSFNFHGPLDDVRIYNRALTAAQATQLYSAESGSHIAAIACDYGSPTSNGKCRGYLVAGSSWPVPADWNNSNNTIEAIGGGGGGGYYYGSGGGGGAYAVATNVTLSGTISYTIGAAGSADTGSGATNGGDTIFNTNTVIAKGGVLGGQAAAAGGTGGAAASCTPATGAFSGGTGGTGNSNNGVGGGGGGAGGKLGNGGNGGSGGGTSVGGAGGGGSSGGSNGSASIGSAGGVGGNNDGGGGGGAAGTNGSSSLGHSAGGGGGASDTSSVVGNGGAGEEWDGSHGSGGGAGGGSEVGGGQGPGGTGGNYGGGGGGGGYARNGGAGAPGIIVITYAPTSNAAISASQPTLVSNGLIGYWTFDGKNLIKNVADSSGQGDNGYLNGFTSTTTVSGKVGQAIFFNEDEVDTPKNIGISGAAPRTVCLWFKTPDTTGAHVMVAFGSTAQDQLYEVMAYNGTFIGHFYVDDSTSGAQSYTANAWNYGCLEYNGTVVTAYLNGAFENSVTLALNTTNTTLVMGQAIYQAGDRHFNGSIDDVRVYNRALSATEIMELYNAGK